MQTPQILNSQNKNILFIDFSNVKSAQEIALIIHQSKNYIRQQPLKSLLVLTSLNMMHINAEIKELFIDFLNENREYVKASAVTGLNSLSQIVFKNTIRQTRRDIKIFNDIEQAKKWLTTTVCIDESRHSINKLKKIDIFIYK